MPRPTAAVGRKEALCVLALALTFFFQALLSMRLESLTGDEVTHLPAGYSYLVTGAFELNRQHPPLLKLLAAAPLLALPLRPPSTFEAWHRRAEWDFGRAFLFENTVPVETLVYWGRIAPIAVGLLLVLSAWRWSRDLWGPRGGLFTLALCALAPDLIAHARYVTTDVALAAFLVPALWCAWRAARSTSGDRWAAAAGVSLGLALAAKYLALVFLPLFAFLWWIERPAPVRWNWRPALRHGALLYGIAFAVATTLTFTPLDPRSYAAGAGQVFADRNPWFEAFLYGRYSSTGFRLYYPAALLVKLPLGVLALAALWLMEHRRAAAWRRAELWALAPIGAYFAIGSISSHNIGIRHVLGVEPLGLVLLGALAAGAGRWRARWLAAAVVAIALEVAWVSPHYLSFFHAAVGGPRRGIEYLDDSNIDWGQDAYRLRRYVEARPGARFKIHYFGPVPMERYGIWAPEPNFDDLFLPLEGVTYVVSAHYLKRSSLSNDCFGVRYRWLERYRPVEWIGGSLCVFRFRYRASSGGGALRLDWDRERARARAEYRAILRRCPGWPPARRGLARLEGPGR
ncbi:MAG TPA: glycosyltransferase family 39 protein [Acidobacteriota bacterium]